MSRDSTFPMASSLLGEGCVRRLDLCRLGSQVVQRGPSSPRQPRTNRARKEVGLIAFLRGDGAGAVLQQPDRRKPEWGHSSLSFISNLICPHFHDRINRLSTFSSFLFPDTAVFYRKQSKGMLTIHKTPWRNQNCKSFSASPNIKIIPSLLFERIGNNHPMRLLPFFIFS